MHPSATGKYRRRTSGRRGNCGDGKETPVLQGRRSIRNEGETPSVMVTVGNQGERYGHRGVV